MFNSFLYRCLKKNYKMWPVGDGVHDFLLNFAVVCLANFYLRKPIHDLVSVYQLIDLFNKIFQEIISLSIVLCLFIHKIGSKHDREQGVRSQGVETSVIERSTCDARVWVLLKRQNKMADIKLDRQRDYPASVRHYPTVFISASNSEGTNYFFSRSFSVLFNFSPANNYLYYYCIKFHLRDLY